MAYWELSLKLQTTLVGWGALKEVWGCQVCAGDLAGCKLCLRKVDGWWWQEEEEDDEDACLWIARWWDGVHECKMVCRSRDLPPNATGTVEVLQRMKCCRGWWRVDDEDLCMYAVDDEETAMCCWWWGDGNVWSAADDDVEVLQKMMMCMLLMMKWPYAWACLCACLCNRNSDHHVGDSPNKFGSGLLIICVKPVCSSWVW